MFIQHDVFIQHVTKIANYKQLEKDLNIQKGEESIIRRGEDWKMHPWNMMQSIRLFLLKISKFTELVVKYYNGIHNGCMKHEPNKNEILDYKAKK